MSAIPQRRQFPVVSGTVERRWRLAALVGAGIALLLAVYAIFVLGPGADANQMVSVLRASKAIKAGTTITSHELPVTTVRTGDPAVLALLHRSSHQTHQDAHLAVMDVPAEFYLETLQHVFMEHDLPRGRFTWRGKRVDPSAIRDTALLTVEGAQDDMCSPGQTEAAHRLCTGIPPAAKQHHLQEGVGHYGVFAGSRWEKEIYPVIRSFIADHRAVREAVGSP